MVKLRSLGLVIVGSILYAALLSLSCSGPVPSAPAVVTTPGPTPLPTTCPPAVSPGIWRNGVAGTWMGQTQTNVFYSTFGVGTSAKVTTQLDNITGDIATLAIKDGGYCFGWAGVGSEHYNITVPTAQKACIFYQSGHLEFNIKLGPYFYNLGPTSLIVGYGNDTQMATYPINPSTLSSFQFTHISIPFTAFTENDTANVTIPFTLYFANPCSNGQVMFLNDIKWTVN